MDCRAKLRARGVRGAWQRLQGKQGPCAGLTTGFHSFRAEDDQAMLWFVGWVELELERPGVVRGLVTGGLP